MINLLPPELKEQYVYGRRNTTLRRWTVAMMFSFLGVVVLTFAGLFLMQNSIHKYQDQVAGTKGQLDSQRLEETRSQAKEISGNIKLAVDVLSREVLFSKLLQQIATVIPPNTSLTDLNITQTTGAIEVKAVAGDYTSATQLQINLKDPKNRIFSKADIQSITCNASASDPKYPCEVTIKALFSTDNPFLFINKGAK
jgi:Tfp pilus assembly protein PilN